MSQSSPLFNRWLGQVGPDRAVEVLTDLADSAAVFAVDAAGKILFWSRGAETLFGIPRDQAIGLACTQVLSCEGGIDPCGLVEHGIIKAQTVRIQCPGGATIPCRRTARGFFDASGQFVGAIEWFRPESPGAAGVPRQEDTESFHGIFSRDPRMKEAIRIIRNVAQSDATVLIRGESGSGKELVARALHLESHRRDRPFLAINCAALTPSLLESELFGHVKGAFTGAVRDHAGVFLRANEGTLFLDEVAELPMELQAKLLRVLQERSFMPVGSDHLVAVDVRIIAATHRSLREQVKAGRFREDLMYRLRVVPVFLPPLRERRQDISFLLWHCIRQHNERGSRRIESVAPEAMRRLLDYAWPGNVRELQNVIEYAFAVGRGSELTLDDLPPEFHEMAVESTVSELRSAQRPRRRDEAELVREALQVSGGHLEQAARLAGMSRATFWRKRKKYGL
ncbi:MAG: sigma 54-interacting transcriptional regulator [Methylotetracoccus sp.]|nr:sigma 54-interacting transcriptional regulator [Methylotetracoccus sp.]